MDTRDVALECAFGKSTAAGTYEEKEYPWVSVRVSSAATVACAAFDADKDLVCCPLRPEPQRIAGGVHAQCEKDKDCAPAREDGSK